MFPQFYEKTVIGDWKNPVFLENGSDDGSGSIMPEEGLLLYGFVIALKPKTILEVGTGHGGATLYMAKACQDNQCGLIHTVEIKEEVQRDAKKHTEQQKLTEFVNFYSFIPNLPQIDLAFLDAKHTKEDVVKYLRTIKSYLKGIVLVHDAYFDNHTVEAARETGFYYLLLPTCSHSGMAILWI